MSSLVRERSPLLAEALGLIGHTAIRTRGTVGGSIAHADPAAELPAAVLALDAAMVCRGPDGERVTSAREFFVDYLTTALESHEVLTEIRLPPWTERSGWSFMEVSRRHGDFAMVGVACTVHVDTNGRFDDARLVLVGVGPTPHESVVGRHALIDREPSEALFLEVQRIVSADAELRPEGDIHASATYRREVAGVLAKRALRVAVARASS
jgi:CO/xanthine dehydrogenase FAD-binding subunit